ncbi:hypothetical protein ASPVEDRAFT_677170 [Aspergillus versicolor CBS 583.65]|uniref:Uncharacterized protein n=1 Tax=Aspergillus versicolor CBS 583.65 TaxID=1036611 RepID=A0A1L9PLS5_ASPVE|nr:uncharacterized protein ASPVEDRAFT_677170 [Aspergillus versicolor CBS 583.65]OJJ02480.1 hypothetical protein ASPVEDRAFT_677170 [Aspergillus versicolor CBS 583.65]
MPFRVLWLQEVASTPFCKSPGVQVEVQEWPSVQFWWEDRCAYLSICDLRGLLVDMGQLLQAFREFMIYFKVILLYKVSVYIARAPHLDVEISRPRSLPLPGSAKSPYTYPTVPCVDTRYSAVLAVLTVRSMPCFTSQPLSLLRHKGYITAIFCTDTDAVMGS